MHDVLVRARSVITRHLVAISQTFFVANPWTGLVGLTVLAVAAPRLAVGALVASVLARVTAERVGGSRALLETGLVELNGWFLGLACSTFYAFGPGLAVALLLGGPLAGVLAILLHRVLATWDLPLTVAPYVPAFWILWLSLGSFPWATTAPLVTVNTLQDGWSSPFVLVLLGGLRGVGEIFFVPNAAVGVGLAVAASIADWRVGPAMLVASIASVGLGHLAGAPGWQVEQGLAGFTPAMIAAAAACGFKGMGRVAVGIAVVVSPFVEAGAVRVAGMAGLYALSTSYVAVLWTFALVRPVREAQVARAGWSIAPRPRVFENG